MRGWLRTAPNSKAGSPPMKSETALLDFGTDETLSGFRLQRLEVFN